VVAAAIGERMSRQGRRAHATPAILVAEVVPMAHNTELGRRGEEIAARHLEARGMQVLARNWRCHHGEIDIVAREGRDTVVVEVKTRTSNDYGHPFEAITALKVGRLRRLAAAWCDASRDQVGGVRIDASRCSCPMAAPR
jgi:putative endonuclease